jgi:hypothetical protein
MCGAEAGPEKSWRNSQSSSGMHRSGTWATATAARRGVGEEGDSASE